MTKKNPYVSVIIPTYNREQYIIKAIESVLSQTYQNYEILVVNDGSNDNTEALLKPYLSKIHYIRQENSGVSAARNKGINYAQGEWIAFLDSDDEWLPEYLSYQMKQVRQNPKICVHMTNSLFFLKNGKIINFFKEKRLLDEFKNATHITIEKPLCFAIKYHMNILITSVMKRINLLDTGLFNTALRAAEDLDLIYRMAIQGPFMISNLPLVKIYRRNEQTINLSKTLEDDVISWKNNLIYLSNNILQNYELTCKEKYALKKAISSYRRHQANILLLSGEKIKARTLYRKAFAECPSIRSLIKYIISYFPSRISISLIKDNKNFRPYQSL